MEGRISKAGQRRRHGQPEIAGCQCRCQCRRRKAPHGEKQHGACTHLVDQKTRRCLAHSRNNEEHRHQQAQFGIAERKIADKPWEQGRQQHVKEMRSRMRHPDKANGVSVLAQRHGGLRARSGGVHAAMVEGAGAGCSRVAPRTDCARTELQRERLKRHGAAQQGADGRKQTAGQFLGKTRRLARCKTLGSPPLSYRP